MDTNNPHNKVQASISHILYVERAFATPLVKVVRGMSNNDDVMSRDALCSLAGVQRCQLRLVFLILN